MPEVLTDSQRPNPPPRSRWSVVLLLTLVLVITAQLITGFTMLVAFGTPLLMAHVGVGVLAVFLTIAEWLWLLCTPAGRYRLLGFFAPRNGPAEWSEGAFFIVASVTVALGVIVAAALFRHPQLPFAQLLSIHQMLAGLTALLYVVHSVFATRRALQRNRPARSG